MNNHLLEHKSHAKAMRMIERYEKDHQFYIRTGIGNGGKSNYDEMIQSILNDPRLVPYDSDNDEPAN